MMEKRGKERGIGDIRRERHVPCEACRDVPAGKAGKQEEPRECPGFRFPDGFLQSRGRDEPILSPASTGKIESISNLGGPDEGDGTARGRDLMGMLRRA